MTRSVFYRVKDTGGGSPGPWIRATGLPPFDITGLTASEVYEIDNEDGTLVERTPTAAASNPTFTRVYQNQKTSSYNTSASSGTTGGAIPWNSIDLSSIPEGEEVHLTVTWTTNSAAATIGTPTLGGSAMNAISGASNSGISSTGYLAKAAMFRLPRPAGAGILDLRVPHGDTGQIVRPAVFIEHVENRSGDVAVGLNGSNSAANTLDITTEAGGAVLACVVCQDATADPAFTAGVTLLGTVENTQTANRIATGKAEGTSAGTLTVTTNRPAGTADQFLIALSVN